MSSTFLQDLLVDGLMTRCWSCMAFCRLFNLLCCHRGQETSMGGEGMHPCL